MSGSWPELGEFRSGRGIGEGGVFLIAVWWWWNRVAGVGDGSRSLDAIRQRRQSGPQLYTIFLIVAPWWRGASIVLHCGRELRDGILKCLPLAGATCRGNRGGNHAVCGNCASCRVLASRMGSSGFGGDSCEVRVRVPLRRGMAWEALCGRGPSLTLAVTVHLVVGSQSWSRCGCAGVRSN